MSEYNSKKVSFDDEMLILVNKDDHTIGYKDKATCHKGDGILHRAFSIFIFNNSGHLLIQKRSHQKTLWPDYWSNSCCSHPRKGEKIENAAIRRLKEELGIITELIFIYKFQYKAAFKDIGTEYELCSVFIGKHNGIVITNHNEISEWRYISVEELDKKLKMNPDDYTPWFRLEWHQLRKQHWNQIKVL